MGISRQIKENFAFLKDYKYKIKIYSVNTDYEVVYSKKDIKILIYYSLCVLTDRIKENGNDFKKLLAESFYDMGVIIEKGNIRRNILDCGLFPCEKLKTLKSTINNIPKNNFQELLDAYSMFLRQNINCLN